jgi:hypothetical protein
VQLLRIGAEARAGLVGEPRVEEAMHLTEGGLADRDRAVFAGWRRRRVSADRSLRFVGAAFGGSLAGA